MAPVTTNGWTTDMTDDLDADAEFARHADDRIQRHGVFGGAAAKIDFWFRHVRPALFRP